MENINDIKIKLIQKVCESENYYLLSSFLKNLENQSKDIVSEQDMLYKSEKPMTDEEVEEYFKEEEIILSPAIMKMIERGMDDIKNGRVYTEEEIDKMDEEWLK
jgi:predicted transcriptional regulator